MKKAFTLIELVVLIFIVIVLGIFVVGVSSQISSESNSDYEWWISPEIQNMKSQKKMADELERQNDLREQELELLKKAERE